MLFLLQLLPDDSLPINTLAALAVIKQRLSSDYFHDEESRLTVGSFGVQGGWLAGWTGARWMHAWIRVCLRL